MKMRSLLSAVLSFCLIAQPVLAEQYIFRYKSGNFSLIPGEPEPPINENDYDITASFLAYIGEQNSFQIPLKPGKKADVWTIRSGFLPDGLTLNAESGVIEGVAKRRGQSVVKMIGYSGDGADISNVNIDITSLERDPKSKQVKVFAHSNRFFEQALANSGEAYSWTPVIPLPSWARMNGMNVVGTPPAGLEGVFSFAMQGKDYTGADTKLVYGEIVVNVGPAIAPVRNYDIEPKRLSYVVPRASNVVGKLVWKLEGDPLPSNLRFHRDSGEISGSIPTFDTSASMRFIAFDTDGTVGYSNYFTISTRSPDLDIKNVQDRTFYVGTFSSMRLSANELDGIPNWKLVSGELPEGITLDASSGVISGTPSKAEVKEGIQIEVTSSTGYNAQSNPFKMSVLEKPLKVAVGQTHVRLKKAFATPEPTVTNGRAPFVFSLAEGQALDAGISLNEATGVVSGSYSTAGGKTVALQARDANGTVSSPFLVGITVYNPLSLTIEPNEIELTRLQTASSISPKIDDNTLIPGEKEALGDFRLDGALPEGLAFNSNTGAITGFGKTKGFYGPLSIQVTDGSGETARSNSFSIKVVEKAPLSVEVLDTSFPTYSSISTPLVKAVSAAGKATWALTQGTLPDGLALSPDGAIVGKATEEGIYPGIVVRATDEEAATAYSEPFAIQITPPEPIELIARDITWAAGKDISISFDARNYSKSVSYAVSAGSLPAGISLSSSGTLSGKVAAPIEAAVTIKATDTLGRSDAKSVNLKFTPPMTMTIDASYDLPRMSSVAIRPEIANAIGKVSFSLSGQLPEGLQFDAGAGAISGKPTKEGEVSNVVLTALDDARVQVSASAKLRVVARDQLRVAYNFSAPLTENSALGLPKYPLEPTNAVGEVVYSISGKLPDGLAFNTKTGAFSGTPRQVGIFDNIVVTGKDAEGAVANSSSIKIAVAPSTVFTVADQSVSGRVNTYVETPPAVVKGAVGAVSFKSTTPNPLGMSVDSASGSIRGVPSALGGQVVQMEATDAAGRKVIYRVTLKVVDALNVSYPDTSASQYTKVSLVPVVKNAIGSVEYSIASGSLGELSIDRSTGVISGTPTTVGTLTFTVLAKDEGTANASYTSGSITVTVDARKPLEIANAEEQNIFANRLYTQTASARNAVGAVTWTITDGSLPEGLTFNPADGKITGTPTVLGTYSITLKAVDSVGGTATKTIEYLVTTDGLPIQLTTYNVKTKSGMPFTSELPLVRNAVGDYSFYSDDLASYGVKLDPVTGVISGRFDSPIRVTGNIHVSDSTNRLTSKPIVIEVIPNIKVSIREQINITASVDMTTVRPTVEYALGAVKYEMIGPELPKGIKFSETSGAIYGIPTILGTFSGYFVEAVDSVGDRTTSNEFSITIYPSGILPTVKMSASYEVAADGKTPVTVTPTVSPKKEGDVYSVNKPLPSGLSIDPVTGKITGAVGSDHLGAYVGYEVSLTDTAGNVSTSNEFAFMVRSEPLPLFSYTPIYTRAGVPFETDVPRLTRGQTVGKVKFTANGTFNWKLKLDQETGIISGTVPVGTSAGSKSAGSTVNFADDVKQYGSSIGLTINVVDLTVSLPKTSFTGIAGDNIVSAAPVVTSNVGKVSYRWASGQEVDGINLDPDTGILSGKLPLGTFSGRTIIASDDLTSKNVTVSFTGKNPPAIFSFDDQAVADAELGSTHESRPVQINGILELTTATISGTNYAYRVCNSSDCSDASWSAFKSTASSVPVNPQQYLQLQAMAPNTVLAENQTTVTINGTKSIWKVKARKLDNVPDIFSFGDPVVGVEQNKTVESPVVMFSGFLDTSTIRIVNPQKSSSTSFYRLCNTSDCSGASYKEVYTSGGYYYIDLAVKSGQYLQLRITSGGFSVLRELTVTALAEPSIIATFAVKTRDTSIVPDAFNFGPPIVGVEPNSTLESPAVELTGFLDSTILRLNNPQKSSGTSHYRLCSTSDCSGVSYKEVYTSGGFYYIDISVKPGQFLQLRITSGAFSIFRELTVTAQADTSVKASYSVQTRDTSIVPNSFDFGQPITGVEPNQPLESPVVEFTGFLDATTIRIVNPQKSGSSSFYRLCNTSDCSGIAYKEVYTSGGYYYIDISVKPGQFLQLRITSGAFSALRELTVTSLTDTTVSSTYSVRTRNTSIVPDAFSFGSPIVGVEPGSTLESPIIEMTGFLDATTLRINNPQKSSSSSYYRLCNTSDCAGIAYKEVYTSGGYYYIDISVKPGQFLQLRITSGAFSALRELTVTSQADTTVKSTYSVKTRDTSINPNAVDFGPTTVTSEVGKMFESPAVLFSGFLDPTTIRLNNAKKVSNTGFYRLCNTSDCAGVAYKEVYTSGGYYYIDISVKPEQYLQLRITSGPLATSRDLTVYSNANAANIGQFVVSTQ